MAGDPDASAAPAPVAATGGYTMGFEMTPLTESGGLDTSKDFFSNKGQMHAVEDDMLFKMCSENRERGNTLVKESRFEEAIGAYSELIMQSRSLEGENDVRWDDAARLQVRTLRATAYLNLSLCFIKTAQWTHATNTATRAIQGDKQPPDAKDDVLPAEKKAKALFRRATAQCEVGNFENAHDDLRKATALAPEDKAIKEMLRKVEYADKKTAKAADKKMAGFLTKKTADGDGLFDDSLRQRNDTTPKEPTEVKKITEGLWMAPSSAEATKCGTEGENDEDVVDMDELGREIAEMREEDPEKFAKLRSQVEELVTQKVEEAEKGSALEPPLEIGTEGAPPAA